MFYADIPVANFTISDAAKRGIDLVREAFNARSSEPAALACIGWGRLTPHSGPPSENVVVSFYGQSYVSQVAKAIQNVSGVKVVFFASPKDYPKFNGKVLDFAAARGFFLREP